MLENAPVLGQFFEKKTQCYAVRSVSARWSKGRVAFAGRSLRGAGANLVRSQVGRWRVLASWPVGCI